MRRPVVATVRVGVAQTILFAAGFTWVLKYLSFWCARILGQEQRQLGTLYLNSGHL
jgi:hypothetical protein